MRVVLADPAPARVVVADDPDGYRVLPGSRHRVAITHINAPAPDPKKKKRPDAPAPAQIMVADAQGRLRIEAAGAALLIEIMPQP
jgi:hypothetical protein